MTVVEEGVALEVILQRLELILVEVLIADLILYISSANFLHLCSSSNSLCELIASDIFYCMKWSSDYSLNCTGDRFSSLSLPKESGYGFLVPIIFSLSEISSFSVWVIL